MDRIQKVLAKLTPVERSKIKRVLSKLKNQQLHGLDIKKLRDRNDIFRARTGNLRIIYRAANSKIFLLAIERRTEKTYRNL